MREMGFEHRQIKTLGPTNVATRYEAKLVGEVTSITYSPRFDSNVGLGYVPAEASDVGTQVVIHKPDEVVTGQRANNDWRTSD